MTVETNLNYVDFPGNGVTTQFPFAFRVDDVDHLSLTKLRVVDAVVTAIGSHEFTVTGIGNEEGGTVTYPVSGAPMPTGYTLRIERVVPFTQELDIANQSGFDANVVERQLDNIVMQIQQVNTKAAAPLGTQDLSVFIPIDNYDGSDPVHEDDIGTSDIDDEVTQTAALNSAWLATGGLPETTLTGLPANRGRPVYLPGNENMVYTFVASEMVSKFIKAFGQGWYRIYEDGVGAYVDRNGASVTISGSLSKLFRLPATPQYLYAVPGTDGDRNPTYIDAPDAAVLDPRYIGGSKIVGRQTAVGLKGGANVYIDGHMQLENPLDYAEAVTLVGRRQFRKIRVPPNRVNSFGTENAQVALTYKPREDGHPLFDNLTDANANSVETVWLRTGTAGSGERRWLEENDVAWATLTAYTAGQARTNGGWSYACILSHTSGASTEPGVGANWQTYWLALNPTTQSTYTGASITGLGYVGSKRVPKYRGDPAYPGSWQMSIWIDGRDNIHGLLDGDEIALKGYKNLGSTMYASGVAGIGSNNFRPKNRILTDSYWMAGGAGANMVVGRKLVLGGRSVLKNTSRAREMVVLGDEAGISIGCSNYAGDNPMTFELETDEPFAAQYGAIVAPASARVVPNGFTHSFIGGYGNFDFATIIKNDINIGALNMLSATGPIGSRIIIANRHPDTALDKFGTIGHYLWRSRGVIGFDLANGGVVINGDVAANFATATTCDQVIGALVVYNRATSAIPFWINDSNQSIFTGTVTDAEVVEIVSTQGDAAAGPTLNLYRDDPSPSAATNGPGIRFYGRNAANTKFQFGSIRLSYTDITAGSEDALLTFRTPVAGVLGNRMQVGAGIYTGAQADKGVDTINTLEYYVAGAKVVGAQNTGWTIQTAASSKANLGASPTVGALASWARAIQDMLATHGLVLQA